MEAKLSTLKLVNNRCSRYIICMLVDFLLRVNMEDILVYWIYPKWNLVIRSYVRRFIFSMMFGRVNLNVSFLLSVRVSKILKYPILPKWKTDKMFSENHLFPKPLSSTILFKGRAINRSAFLPHFILAGKNLQPGRSCSVRILRHSCWRKRFSGDMYVWSRTSCQI